MFLRKLVKVFGAQILIKGMLKVANNHSYHFHQDIVYEETKNAFVTVQRFPDEKWRELAIFFLDKNNTRNLSSYFLLF